jgi:hypothetical protein
MQGSLSGRESVLDIQPDLVRLEVRLKAWSGHRAAAASADTATAVGAQSASILALEAKIEELSEQLRAIRGQAGAASRSGRTQGGARPQRRERRCYRCGGVDHLVSACPLPEQRGPFAGQGTLRCTPAAVCGSRWMVDSGCSDDMHPGGSLGERAFVNYRRFDQPLAVHLAKKGAHTQAVGVGQMELRGCTGAVVLSNVLHVPELDHPLFSVRQALARGWDVTFTHSKLFGSAEEVAVTHKGCIVLTGRGRGNLFFLDNAPCVTAGSAVAPSVQQLTKAWECHRRLGHVGFRRLADLKRKCLLGADDPSPAAFVQARKQKACEPCVLGKLRRVSHPPRVPHHVRPLHRLHVDLGDLPHGGYLSTVIDEGTRSAVVAVLQRKSNTEVAVRNAIEWFECQTDLRVQRVRSDRGGEYMGGHLICSYEKKGIQWEQGPGYSPEVNGLAERY